jgi:hypothetical protein
LSIWELRASRQQMRRLLGANTALEVGKVVLNRNSFAFDECLCWCRSTGDMQEGADPRTVVEIHLHGGFGVAAALRTWLHKQGWTEECEGQAVSADLSQQTFLQATSPLAARIFAARLGGSWDRHLQKLRALAPAQRQGEKERLRAWNDWGKVLAGVPKLLLAGPPNAGKSTLFNAWLQERRVTANEAAGTTRDLVTAPLRLGQGAEAFVVTLTDSAGVWEQAKGIDQAAVAMTKAALASAWRVIWVFDAAEAPSAQILAAVADRPAHDPLVLNRCDRAATWPAEKVLPRPFLRAEPSSQASLLAALERQLLGQLGPAPPINQLVATSQAERDALEAL